jgi:capsular polysaccharide biosynthesis protein
LESKIIYKSTRHNFNIKNLFILFPHTNPFKLDSGLQDLIKDFSLPKKFTNTKVYISRKDATRRKCTNEFHLIEELKKKNYKIIEMTKLPIESQVNIFRSSEIVIGIHGAGLAFNIFSSENLLIEIIPPYFSLGGENPMYLHQQILKTQSDKCYYQSYNVRKSDFRPLKSNKKNKNKSFYIDVCHFIKFLTKLEKKFYSNKYCL